MVTTVSVSWLTPDDGNPDFYFITISQPGHQTKTVTLAGTKNNYIFDTTGGEPVHFQIQSMNSRGLKSYAVSIDIRIP